MMGTLNGFEGPAVIQNNPLNFLKLHTLIIRTMRIECQGGMGTSDDPELHIIRSEGSRGRGFLMAAPVCLSARRDTGAVLEGYAICRRIYSDISGGKIFLAKSDNLLYILTGGGHSPFVGLPPLSFK
jgi:hypothetical protein